MRCFSRQWTRCSSNIIEKGIATWRSPGLQCTNTIGKYTKTQCVGVKEGLLRVKQFNQTRLNAIILYNTLPAMCVDKVVIRKSGEELCSKTHQSPSAPQRIVLRPHYGRQDTTSSDARTSLDHSSQHKENCDGGTYKETYRGEIDFRIQALPHSVVQEYDHIRKEAVQKLSHQFETHPNKEALQRDLKQNRAFNPFSEQTKEMMYSMGNMEYFEIFEVTPNIQCPNCVTRWPKVIVFCTRGRCLRPPDKVRKLNSDRFDVLSIPNYVIKKSPFHGARHGNTERERERIHHAAHVSSKKAEKKGFT